MMAPRRGSLKFENFISLVLQRNYDAIKLAFSAEDFDINKEDFRGVTVLHYAAELDDVELIKMILKEQPKVKINAKTLEMMSTPLMIAAGNGKICAMNVLLEHGADPSCQNAAGFTALMIATEANSIECVKLLLRHERDCNITAQNFRGLNALMLAVNSVELTQKLIYQSDLTQVDIEGNTVYHLACKHGNTEVITTLLNHSKSFINTKNLMGQTPLHFAIQSKNLNVTDILISNGADILEKDSRELNAFQYAAIIDDTEEFLKKYKCPIEEVDNLFIVAAENGRLTILQELVNSVNEFTLENSLISASSGGHLDCVKLIFEQIKDSVNVVLIEAAIEALSSKKFECFHFLYKTLQEDDKFADLLKENEGNLILNAFTSGCVEACELFLSQGIDPNGNEPETLLMAASANGHIEVVKLLIEYSADVNRIHDRMGSALLLATINNSYEIVKCLLDHGADSTIADESGFTPLISAAYYGYTNIFKTIFGIDNNVNQRTNDGLTPLLAACLSGQVEIVKSLMEYNPNLKYTDDSGNNCFHCAAEDIKGLNVLLFLVDKIDDLDLLTKAKNNNGKTPLDLLISHQNQSIIFSLLASKPEISEYLTCSNNFIIENDENGGMCLICRDDFVQEDAATMLPCKHLFHECCYGEWSVTKPNCPYCQRFPFRIKN